MRRLLVPLTLLPALALTLAAPACGGASGSFRGNGTGVPVDPGQVRVINSKDDLNEPYKELGIAKAKGPSAADAVDLAKQHCGNGGGGDLLIMNTEPFQSGSVWRVDATCAKSDKPVAAPSGGGKPSGTGKAIH